MISDAGTTKYVWPFSGHQSLDGVNIAQYKGEPISLCES